MSFLLEENDKYNLTGVSLPPEEAPPYASTVLSYLHQWPIPEGRPGQHKKTALLGHLLMISIKTHSHVVNGDVPF